MTWLRLRRTGRDASAADPVDPQSLIIRRQRAVVVVAVACALLSTAGLIASRFIKSPEQAAAETSAPPASVITAPVVEQVLATTLIFRGTVDTASRVTVTPGTSSASNATTAVVSREYVHAGDSVSEGQVLIEVSGRPVVALAGSVPAYRDMRPGDSGPDVRQLQSALDALGYYTATIDGKFGQATKDAVSRLYNAIGYDVPTTGSANPTAEQAALQAAHDAVTKAQTAVNNMKQQIAEASPQPSPSSQPSPSPSATPAPTSNVSDLEQELQQLEDALAKAQADEQDLIDRTGPMLPAAEVAFMPGFPAQVAAVGAKLGQPVATPLITLTTGSLVVTSRLDPTQAKLVSAGLPARLDAEVLGASAEATVSAVGALTTDAPGGTGAPTPTTPYVPVTIAPGDALPPNWAGQDVRVTVTLAQTSTPVLAVPVSAITTRADGQTIVTVVKGGRVQAEVVVQAGVSANGLIEVTPIQGNLVPGDLVAVGQAATP